MKRKLDTNDVPTPTPSSSQPTSSPKPISSPQSVIPTPKESSKSKQKELNFEVLGLDSRLLQGIKKLGFEKPTRVQVEAVTKVLEGRDVLARAKTGSGKTGAYLWGVLQGILRAKEASTYKQYTSALILVPTRELADQVYKAVESFTTFCARDIKAVNIAQKISTDTQRNLLETLPDIVVSTPARAAENNKVLNLETLRWLVIDEADLVLSYGHDKDLEKIRASMPNTGCQTVMMSATLTDEVDQLTAEFCKNPVVLKLDEKDAEGEGVSQYVVKCAEDEKFLLIYVIFKLKLIKGKCIIFVADIDRCYRLKLYLEQFGIRSCILNSELPVNSRIHVVEEFNKNVYDIIIAADEHEVVGNETKEKKVVEEEVEVGDAEITNEKDVEEGEEPTKATAEPAKKKRKTGKGAKRDKEYGVSRGIDFKNVACVINFDLPTSSKSYTHRIGRTARAGQTGMALSFVIPETLYRKHKPTSIPCTKHDELILRKITKTQAKAGKEVKPYNFDMKQVDGFRYRMGDALRAVTKVAIREARTRELRQELISSEKLKRHFEENPGDLRHLRHDGELRPARVQAHLKHVPEYLLPKEGRAAITRDVGFVGMRKEGEGRRDKKKGGSGRKVGGGVKKRVNPLKSFKAKRK